MCLINIFSSAGSFPELFRIHFRPSKEELKMALSYEEGMSALRTMFPSWDAQVLAELLEVNEGHLENTIDMVLTMEPPVRSDTPSSSASPSGRSHGASARQLDASNDSYALPPAYAAAAAAAASPAPAQAVRKSPRRKAGGHQRTSHVTLPDDFLMLPVDSSYGRHELSEQEQRDAILAEMLQNEIFRQELITSEEFSEHFNGDRPQERTRANSTRSSTTAYPDKTASEIASETFNAMSVKFSSMSEGLDIFKNVCIVSIYS